MNFFISVNWRNVGAAPQISLNFQTLAQLRHSDRDNTNHYTTLGQPQNSDHDNRKNVQFQNH